MKTQTTHIKEFLEKTRLKKADVAQVLNVTPQHLNSVLRRGTEVFIVHEGEKILDCLYIKKWGNVL